jgi:uracil-DNA glycosylase
MTRWIESGDPRSPVWIIAEAPGEDEIRQGRPLVGQSGQELDRCLRDAGWPPDFQFFRTNICHQRPPSYQNKYGKWIHNDIEQFFVSRAEAKRSDVRELLGRFPLDPVTEGIDRLSNHLQHFRPTLIIALGGISLWALGGKEGILKWRGSILSTESGIKAISTLHPADILYQWQHRPLLVQDLRRALRESKYSEIRRPTWNFVIAPTIADLRDWLLPCIERRQPLVCDTEGWGVVDCVGFAANSKDAICVPFVREAGQLTTYFTPGDAEQAMSLCTAALRQCPVTFHNATWDCQVIARRWGMLPNLTDDTMVMQHALFPGLLGGKIDPTTGTVEKKGSSLSLSFIASMYCEYYSYWKDDGRVRGDNYDDDTYWKYNCEDCVRTYECREVLTEALRSAGLEEQYRFLMSLFAPVLSMMFRGMRLDRERVKDIKNSIVKQRADQQQWLDTAVGFPLNVGSAPQVHSLFYDDLRQQKVLHRSTRKPSVDDTALETIARRQPLLLPLCRTIQNIRSLNTNERNFVAAAEKAKDRLYTCLNITGAETFRFSSNETAFGEGCNLQNLTRPPEDQ